MLVSQILKSKGEGGVISLKTGARVSNLVGPDMIAVALQFEKMGNLEKAKQFLNPVVLDFTSLVQDVEEGLSDNEVMDEDFPITESLIQALEGLKRLGEDINEDTLKNSKEVLEKLKKATNTVYSK